MGQVIELEFKLAHHELRHIQDLINRRDLRLAIGGFPRVYRLMETLTKNWEILATLTPAHFNGFRDYLGTASGFGSYMYRHLEFALGNKNERLLKPHENVPHLYYQIREAFESPSLYDDVIRLLAERGFNIDSDHLERDCTQPYSANQSVEDAWLTVYQDPRADNELYELAERLVDLSERLREWRYHHLVTVERMIGFKPGTGGTAGVQWLRNIVEHEFFPELWSVRTRL
jgi:tryptophan 2,3-dioxygenase